MSQRQTVDMRSDSQWWLTRSDEGRVQGFYPVGSHDNFDVSPGVEAIQLVEQLQHGSLDLPLTARVGVIPSQHRQESFLSRIYRICFIALQPQTLRTSSLSILQSCFHWSIQMSCLLSFPCEVKKPSHVCSANSYIIYVRQHPTKVWYRPLMPVSQYPDYQC